MNELVLTVPMITVFALLLLTVVLFVFDLLRVDLVGLLMMVLLPLCGVVSPDEAVAGLSSNAVVSIIAIMILSKGLNVTGIMNLVAAKIVHIAGKSEVRIMVIIASTVAVISSFMQNIGAAALFMPATIRICRQIHISAARILMPMGFCAITGGCLTLIGSSPLIMLNDLMASWWDFHGDDVAGAAFIPLSLFSVTPIGISLLVAILLYFAFIGRRLLPGKFCETDEESADRRLQEIYGTSVGHSIEVRVPFSFSPQTLFELGLRHRYHVTVIGIARGRSYRKNLSPLKDTTIEPGDVLWVMSSDDNIKKVSSDYGWEIKKELDIFHDLNYPEVCGVVEGVVIPHSNLSGHSLDDLHFRETYMVNPLAIVRGDEIIMENISITKLKQGDTLLLQGRWKQFRLIAKKMGLAFIEEIYGEDFKPERIPCAFIFLTLSLVLALGFDVRLSIALLTGALGMVVTNVIPADRAYEAVDWRTVFLLSGLIPLGTAFEKTGAAAYLAGHILSLVGEPSPLVFLFIISLLSSFFSLVASNVGAVVLMVPLAMNMALTAKVNPVVAAMVVAISASNTFVLPTHQVNALIMRPGGYKTKDYMRVGLGATFLYTVTLICCLAFFYQP